MDAMNNSDKERAFLNAKRRVEKLKGFYNHLAVYLVVNIVISTFKIIRNLSNGESLQDAIFDLSFSGVWLLWGIGLAIHAIAVFALPLILGNNWEEEKIKKFMEEEEKKNNYN